VYLTLCVLAAVLLCFRSLPLCPCVYLTLHVLVVILCFSDHSTNYAEIAASNCKVDNNVYCNIDADAMSEHAMSGPGDSASALVASESDSENEETGHPNLKCRQGNGIGSVENIHMWSLKGYVLPLFCPTSVCEALVL
jgi:hypothetical protein